jgi:hypothetical protein
LNEDYGAVKELAREPISQSYFDRVVARYISWASEWDGTLPADVFFGVWADFRREDRQIELRARIVEGHLQFTGVSPSPLRVQRNRIYLEDGRVLVIQLETAQ